MIINYVSCHTLVSSCAWVTWYQLLIIKQPSRLFMIHMQPAKGETNRLPTAFPHLKQRKHSGWISRAVSSYPPESGRVVCAPSHNPTLPPRRLSSAFLRVWGHTWTASHTWWSSCNPYNGSREGVLSSANIRTSNFSVFGVAGAVRGVSRRQCRSFLTPLIRGSTHNTDLGRL